MLKAVKTMFKLRNLLAALAVAAVGAIACLPAHAALVQTFTPSTGTAFDTTLQGSGNVLIYDANYYSATEGRLVVLTNGSTLAGPGVPGSNGIAGSAPGQNYLGGPGGADTLRDVVITMRINNATGALISGTVNVPVDVNAAAANTTSGGVVANDSWSYSGFITNFGVAANDGGGANTFDARWFATAYDFSDVVANPSLSVPGAPQACTNAAGQCGYGYLRIGTSGVPFLGGTGTGVNFGIDWVRGIGAPNAQLGTYDDNIAASAFVANPVLSDVFLTPVPIPAALVLFAGGLAGLLPIARRRRH